MRVAVFGATGRTGTHVREQALARGHEVRAFARDASSVDTSDPRVTLVVGDARDVAAVDTCVGGCDAVISVLSLRAPDREPEHSEATSTIVRAAERAGVRRVVVTANNEVLTDREVTGEFAAAAREHRRNRDTLEASGLEWTMLAAPTIAEDAPSGSYAAVVGDRAPGKRISPADFAAAAVDALEREEWVGRVVGVSAG